MKLTIVSKDNAMHSSLQPCLITFDREDMKSFVDQAAEREEDIVCLVVHPNDDVTEDEMKKVAEELIACTDRFIKSLNISENKNGEKKQQ